MFPFVPLLSHPQQIAALAGCVVASAGMVAYLLSRKTLSREEIETRRRSRLARDGRLIDGTLVDTNPADSSPETLIYRYRVSGVTYECGQDVSMLRELLPDLGETSAVFGLPVQVRYDRRNPADSIVLSETWNGLWDQHAVHPGNRAQTKFQ